MVMAAVIVLINAFLFRTVYSSTCESLKLANLDKALVGHSVLDINDTKLIECARTCMSMSVCKSIDFNRKENTCQLNDVDRSSVHPFEFETKRVSTFSDITEWPSVSISFIVTVFTLYHNLTKQTLHTGDKISYFNI
jgi:hypothetical protein